MVTDSEGNEKSNQIIEKKMRNRERERENHTHRARAKQWERVE